MVALPVTIKRLPDAIKLERGELFFLTLTGSVYRVLRIEKLVR